MVPLEALALGGANGITDGPFGSAVKEADYRPSGVPMIRGGNLSLGDFRLRLDELVFILDELADRHPRAVAVANDVVFTKKGTIGSVGIIPVDSGFSRFFISSNQMKATIDPAIADPLFVYYVFAAPPTRSRLLREASVTGVPKINLGYLRAFRVPLPPLNEQRRITHILSALDDKIELNRKMNQTLEEMAQAIFKSWFIDFDGHDDLVDSENGSVPRGWKFGGIDAVADNVRDTVDPSSLANDTPYVGLEHVPRRCVALDTWGRASDAGSTKTRFQRGDTLFGKLRPYFHKVVPAPVNGVSSTDILVIRPKQDDWRWFAFGHLYSDAMVAHTTAAAYGTKMPRTNWKDLCRFPVALPPRERAAEYGRIVMPMYERIAANVQESHTLAELRDTLLPKLISGELRVPEAEALVEAAS